jgi:tetratricopeptide (TPR) repeat protein
LSKRPNNSGVLNNLAYFFAKTGTNIDKAVEYAKRAHKVNPNDSNVMDTYAFTLCKAGQYKQAKELLLSAIGLIEKDDMQLPWDLINHLGMANEGLSEMQEAMENYKKALELAGNAISTSDKEELIAAVARVSN